MVELSEIRKSEKNKGIEVEYYKLSKIGLLNILSYEIAWKNIDEIAINHDDILPLIFGKWVFFKKNNILEEIKKRLKIGVISSMNYLSKMSLEDYNKFDDYRIDETNSSNDIQKEFSIDVDRIKRNELIIKNEISYTLTQSVFGISRYLPLEEKNMNVLKIIKTDLEINDFIIKELNFELKHAQDDLNGIKQWIKYYEEIK